VKEESLDTWIRNIETAGWEPDAWALTHGPHLLHAEAAAAWALTRGDEDPAVVAAVRHHPTGDPAWESVGRLLFVADFCEPTRRYADEIDTAALRSRAGEGEEGLAEAARRVLALRLQWLIGSVRPIHPRSWSTWNAWSLDRSRRFGQPSPAP
jgi:HD superfamily phosphohydrolase YqeK